MIGLLKKVGLIFMAITTTITLNACSEVNNDTAKVVCAALSEKYGESFEAIKIGDRLNTDSAKLYVHPTEHENLVFTARIDRKTGEVSDDYIRCINEHYIEKKVRVSMDTSNIRADVKAVLSCSDTSEENNTDITFDEFSEKYSLTGIMLYMPIDENDIYEEKVSEITELLTLLEQQYHVRISILAYCVPNENFTDCIDAMSYEPEITGTWFDGFSCKARMPFSVSEQGITPNVQEITRKLKGE